MRGNGGNWNRAGRRSGGSRPTRIYLPALTCPDCGNDHAPAFSTPGCEGCALIHGAWRDGLLPALLDKLRATEGGES